MSLSEDVIVESLTNRENSGDLTSEETMSVNPQCQHPVFLWGLVDVVSSKVNSSMLFYLLRSLKIYHHLMIYFFV